MGERKRILVIEDSIDWFIIMQTYLSHHEVHWATNTVYAQNLMTVFKFDLIICDYMGVDLLSTHPSLNFLEGHNYIVSSSLGAVSDAKNFVPKDDIKDYFKDNGYM